MRQVGHKLFLSRRNLLSLLHKLDMPGSRRTIFHPDCNVVVVAEDDAEHYKDRTVGAGPMHPDTEKFVEGSGGVPAGYKG